MKYILMVFLLFILGCGNARTPNSVVQDETSKLESTLNNLVGQQYTEAIKVFGNTNRVYNDELKKDVLDYSYFIIILNDSGYIDRWKIYAHP